MSDTENLDAEELYDDVLSNDEVIEKPAKKKRVLSTKEIESRRKNLANARAKRLAEIKSRKENDDEYEQYVVEEPKLVKTKAKSKAKPKEVEYESEYSDEEEYERPKKGKKGLSKAEEKKLDRLDRMEKIMENIVRSQYNAKKKPSTVNQTIVQIPKSGGNKSNVLPPNFIDYFKPR